MKSFWTFVMLICFGAGSLLFLAGSHTTLSAGEFLFIAIVGTALLVFSLNIQTALSESEGENKKTSKAKRRKNPGDPALSKSEDDGTPGRRIKPPNPDPDAEKLAAPQRAKERREKQSWRES